VASEVPVRNQGEPEFQNWQQTGYNNGVCLALSIMYLYGFAEGPCGFAYWLYDFAEWSCR